MPVYEYFCPACKSSFEEMRPMSRLDDPAECPDCATRSRKKLSLFAIGHALAGAGMLTMAEGSGCACGGNCACGA